MIYAGYLNFWFLDFSNSWFLHFSYLSEGHLFDTRSRCKGAKET